MDKHWQQIYSKLPETRKDIDWKNRVSLDLPSINGEDSSTQLFSKEEVKKWFKDFKSKYNENPELVDKGNKIEVTNDSFIKKQDQYKNLKSNFLKGSNNLDENKNYKMKTSEAKKLVKEQILSSLSEKKKGKKDETDTEEVDASTEFSPESEEPETSTNDVDPNIKAIQTALTKAQTAANELGDQKLITQIGNSLTYFTRSHISKTEVSEGLDQNKTYTRSEVIEILKDFESTGGENYKDFVKKYM